MNFKNLLLSLFLLLFTANLFAQETTPVFSGDKQFFGGLVLGLNVAQVDGDSYSGFHQAGLNAGGIVYWRFSKPVAASVELLYSQKGSHNVRQSTDPYAGAYFSKYSIRLNYAELPLVFHYFLSPKYQIGFGGSYNALISSKESLTLTYPVHIDENLFPFNKYSIDLIGSISMVVWNGFMLNARYQYGITPVRNYQYVPQGIGGGNQFNNMVTFRILYLF